MTEQPPREVASAIVLAGGRSTRMGRDKLRLAIGDETLLEHTVRTVHAVCDDVLIAGLRAGSATLADTRVVSDAVPDAGPLGGLVAGLRSMRHDRAVVVACDLPFLQPALLRYLLASVRGQDAAVPVVAGHSQPTCAVYRTSSLPAAERLLVSTRRSLRALLAQLQVRWVDERELRAVDAELRSFINVNTPEEWESARR